jgi:hypothetical protein
MNASDRASSSTLIVPVTEDFVLNAGSWHQAIDQDRRLIAYVDPPPVPMFEQVAKYLEAKPLPCAGYVRLVDEARAAVAVCLRWGSYFAVLADASRPFSPDVRDERVSQIDDDEMARMNIEISSAIQWWLTLKGSDEQGYAEFLQRALAYLPLGRKTVMRSPEGDVLRDCATAAMADAVGRAWPAERLEHDLRLAETHGVRAIANTIALLSWRNGPIEDVHAGHSSAHALNERRVLLRGEKAIVRQAQDVLLDALEAMEHMVLDGAWPPPAGRVLPFMRPFCHPHSWTYTGQNREVRIPLRANSVHGSL